MNQSLLKTPVAKTRATPRPHVISLKRVAILDAATEMFLNLGYDATSMNALVASIGGSKSTIYAHFNSKHALFKAVTEHIMAENMSDIHNDMLKNLTLKEGLHVIGHKLLDLVTSDHHIRLARLIIAETPSFPEIGRAYYEWWPSIATQEISAFLTSATSQQKYPAFDSDVAAQHFSSMLVHHTFLERLCGKRNAPSAKAQKIIVTDAASNFIKLYDLDTEART